MIDNHDAISFDLFDTLIMRKTLESEDIFDIVDKNIKKYGIYIHNFKKKRKTVQKESEDIFTIYKNLKNVIDLSDEKISLIMKEELACEKVNIIPRDSIVEAFNYALKKGKIVSIVSNIHLPSNIIQDILDNIGITGYNNLFISCEYGKKKSEGLFKTYIKKIGSNKKFLHIGTNYVEDILFAQKNGITTFYLKSGLELLKMSKIHALLLKAYGFENRLFIGLIVSKLFNDPFILCNTGGYVPVSSEKIFTEVFIAPLVYIYMRKLVKHIHDNEYDGVIFPTRDGHLFHHLYEKYRKKDKSLPNSYYVTISRKIAQAISQYDCLDILETSKKYISDKDNLNFWKEIMYFHTDDVGKILKESEEKRKLYIKYLQNIGIDFEKKYLFCDLITANKTTQYALSKIFDKKVDGFYLGTLTGLSSLESMTTYVYPIRSSGISTKVSMLEEVFSSPESSAGGIDDNGIFYELDERTSNEVSIMMNIHKYVEECEDIYQNLELVDISLPNNLLALIDGIKFCGEMGIFIKRATIDTMSLQKDNIMWNVIK